MLSMTVTEKEWTVLDKHARVTYFRNKSSERRRCKGNSWLSRSSWPAPTAADRGFLPWSLPAAGSCCQCHDSLSQGQSNDRNSLPESGTHWPIAASYHPPVINGHKKRLVETPRHGHRIIHSKRDNTQNSHSKSRFFLKNIVKLLCSGPKVKFWIELPW